MNQPPAAGSERPSIGAGEASVRRRLARLAHTAALAVEGVADTSSGPAGRWLTAGGGERVPGVVATILPSGRYGLELHLVADPVPLRPLADRVRRRIEAAAASAGLADAIGPVDIRIDDLASSDVDPAPPGALSRTAAEGRSR